MDDWTNVTPIVNASPIVVIPDDFGGYDKHNFLISRHFLPDIDKVLIPGGLIADRIERMACDIANDIGHESFTALCVLKGGYQFFSDLLRMLRQYYRFASFASDSGHNSQPNAAATVTSQQIKVEFVRIKSYEDDSSTGKVSITGIESLENLKGANVLIVEDIIDTGTTMERFIDVLKNYELKSVRVASLFLKRNPRSNGFLPHYTGFEIPDRFVIGYNLDYNDYYREMNHICIISEEGKRKYSAKNVQKQASDAAAQ